MKIGAIAKKIKLAKQLMNEYSMLDAMLNTMVKAKKEHPDELSFDEDYFQRVAKRIDVIKSELDGLFK